MLRVNPLFKTDSYKVSHLGFSADGTQVIYSNLTARSFRMFLENFPGVDLRSVFFGLQAFVKEDLMEDWNVNFFQRPKAEVIAEVNRLFNPYLGGVPTSHFEALHDLGYLPIEIRALTEGSLVPEKVPYLTIKNTHDDFQWITNYLETIISSQLWKTITVATVAYNFRKLSNTWAKITTGSTAGTEFQNHDFSFRGQSNWQSAASLGAAFLLSSNGTDNIPAIPWLEHYYDANVDNEFIAASVPASEHSVSCLGTAVSGELEFIRNSITKAYPTGIVSIVSDTYDYWHVLKEYLPALKDDILNRQENALGLAKVVIRPDSGDPVRIICGRRIAPSDRRPVQGEVVYHGGKYYECKLIDNENNDWVLGAEVPEHEVKGSIEMLWDLFGGTVNELGYKVLNPRIGLIYGDSITFKRANQIYLELSEKGFASTNVVFGIGSYSLSVHSRDTLGMAIKATAAKVNDQWIELFKDPKTDNGTKKSAKGLLRVEKENGRYKLYDQQTPEQAEQGALELVFRNGVLYRETTFAAVKKQLWG